MVFWVSKHFLNKYPTEGCLMVFGVSFFLMFLGQWTPVDLLLWGRKGGLPLTAVMLGPQEFGQISGRYVGKKQS